VRAHTVVTSGGGIRTRCVATLSRLLSWALVTKLTSSGCLKHVCRYYILPLLPALRVMPCVSVRVLLALSACSEGARVSNARERERPTRRDGLRRDD